MCRITARGDAGNPASRAEYLRSGAAGQVSRFMLFEDPSALPAIPLSRVVRRKGRVSRSCAVSSSAASAGQRSLGPAVITVRFTLVPASRSPALLGITRRHILGKESVRRGCATPRRRILLPSHRVSHDGNNRRGHDYLWIAVCCRFHRHCDHLERQRLPILYINKPETFSWLKRD